MGNMGIAVSTLAGCPIASSAELRARELITVASIPIWSPLTRYLESIGVEAVGVDAVALFAHERFSGKLEKNTVIFHISKIYVKYVYNPQI